MTDVKILKYETFPVCLKIQIKNDRPHVSLNDIYGCYELLVLNVVDAF